MNTQTNAWQIEPSKTPQETTSLMQKLPALLRLLGAAALLVAMYSFLTKGWQNGNDLFRYLLLLGHTAALAVIGLASGHWLKEGKGARLLLTLALAAVPANFAILGAFIFSQTAALDMSVYPEYVAWSVNSLQTALTTNAAAMLVLIPVVLLGFTVLTRSMSKKLSVMFLISNAMLLLPLRDPQLIGLLALTLTACILFFSHKTAQNHVASRTKDGVTALALQLLPLAVLTVRSLWLYSIDLFLLTAMSATFFLIMRQISKYLDEDSRTRSLMDTLSVIPALFTGICFSATLYDTAFLPDSLATPLGGFVAAAMIYDIAYRNKSVSYQRIAIAAFLLCSISNLLHFGDLAAALACILGGLALVLLGYKMRQRNLLVGGGTLMLAGTAHQLYQLVLDFDLGAWSSLAILGTAAIVIASVMESQGGSLKPRLESWKEKLQQWEQ